MNFTRRSRSGDCKLHLFAAVHEIQAALEKDARRVVDDIDLLRRKSAAAHADPVDSRELILVGHGDEGRHVLPDQGAALNHRMLADAYPLVHGCMTADNGPVADLDLARDTRLAITQWLPTTSS